MADADPNIPNAPLEGRYLPAEEIAASAAALCRVKPPAPPYGDDRLIRIRRSVLNEIIEQAMAALDEVDGDPDIEANGDEQDHDQSEDCFIEHERAGGPGCPIADPDAAVDDQPCDACSEDGL